MPHLALLGDASLANGRYTAPEPDTVTQVQQQLPDWTVTLLAAGGATMAEIPAQLQRFPAGVDLAVLSVGGNDALEHVGLLQQPSKSSSDTLDALHRMVQEFSEKYDKVVPVLSRLAGRVLLCTIYEAPLVGENTASRARVVLTLLNDYILRTAARGGMDVLDVIVEQREHHAGSAGRVLTDEGCLVNRAEQHSTRETTQDRHHLVVLLGELLNHPVERVERVRARLGRLLQQPDVLQGVVAADAQHGQVDARRKTLQLRGDLGHRRAARREQRDRPIGQLLLHLRGRIGLGRRVPAVRQAGVAEQREVRHQLCCRRSSATCARLKVVS